MPRLYKTYYKHLNINCFQLFIFSSLPKVLAQMPTWAQNLVIKSQGHVTSRPSYPCKHFSVTWLSNTEDNFITSGTNIHLDFGSHTSKEPYKTCFWLQLKNSCANSDKFSHKKKNKSKVDLTVMSAETLFRVLFYRRRGVVTLLGWILNW